MDFDHFPWGHTGNLAGKTAVVTNATFGAGLSTAKLLASQGARVLITARRSRDLDWALTEIGENSAGIVCQTHHFETVNHLFSLLSQTGGGLDILYAFADQGSFATFGHLTDDLLRRVLTRLWETLLLVQHAIPIINPGGAIILSGSHPGVRGHAGFGLYEAIDSFTRHLLKAWIRDFASAQIRFNLLSPGGGTYEVPLHIAPEQACFYDDYSGRTGESEMVALVAAYLASPDCRFDGMEVFADGSFRAI